MVCPFGDNDEPRAGLPSLPGTYVLVLKFSKRLEIVVGIHLNLVTTMARTRFLESVEEQADALAVTGEIAESNSIGENLMVLDTLVQTNVSARAVAIMGGRGSGCTGGIGPLQCGWIVFRRGIAA